MFPNALESIPQYPTAADLDYPPTADELSKALANMPNGKAPPGADGMPTDMLKAGGKQLDIFYVRATLILPIRT